MMCRIGHQTPSTMFPYDYYYMTFLFLYHAQSVKFSTEQCSVCIPKILFVGTHLAMKPYKLMTHKCVATGTTV